MDTFAPGSVEVICDRCGALFDFDEWSVIPNVFLPDVAKRLCDGNLFEAVCPECGNIHLMLYRCLYHDVPNAKLVLLDQSCLRKRSVGTLVRMTHRDGDGPSDAPRHAGRLVFHPDALSEKARIFAAGLDDYPIELVKLRIKERLIGEDALFETVLLYFDRKDGVSLFFEASGYEDGEVVVPMSIYDQMVADLKERLPRIDDFIVDERWAQRYLAEAVLSEAESVL